MTGALITILFAAHPGGQVSIHIWYGHEQHFGRLGIPQRWVNVLGSVTPAEDVASLTYSLNGAAPSKLSAGQNTTRLAGPGDFNVELDHRELRAGKNIIAVTATDKAGRQWYPLGAATEFQLFPDLTACHWRIIPDGGKNLRLIYSTERSTITLNRTYVMKARVESLPDQHSRYRTKIWVLGETEPQAWAVESTEGATDLQFGSLLLVAHNSDVTFGNLKVIPLGTRG